jgi:hypothetical protein
MFPLGRPTHRKACRLKSFYLNYDQSFFFISGISGPLSLSLFPFLHFTIAEASVDMIAGMVLQTRFLSATGRDDGLLQKRDQGHGTLSL